MSMTLEEAIKNREDCMKYLEGLGSKASPDCLEAVRWSVKALKALRPVSREQVEKVWRGCEYCSGDRPPEGGCEIKDYAETCEECRFCDTTLERPPEGEERHMTNADKIRAMSDEELAKLMANSCPCVYPDCNGYRDYSDDSCIKHLLEWLRQPVEED